MGKTDCKDKTFGDPSQICKGIDLGENDLGIFSDIEYCIVCTVTGLSIHSRWYYSY